MKIPNYKYCPFCNASIDKHITNLHFRYYKCSNRCNANFKCGYNFRSSYKTSYIKSIIWNLSCIFFSNKDLDWVSLRFPNSNIFFYINKGYWACWSELSPNVETNGTNSEELFDLNDFKALEATVKMFLFYN